VETKPGVKTTEFWVSIFTAGYMFLNTTGAIDQIPKTWSGIAMAIVSALYAVSRGQAKQGVKPDPS